MSNDTMTAYADELSDLMRAGAQRIIKQAGLVGH